MSLATRSFCEHLGQSGTCRLGPVQCIQCVSMWRKVLIAIAYSNSSLECFYTLPGVELRLIHGKMSYYLYLHLHCSASLPKTIPLVGDHKVSHKEKEAWGQSYSYYTFH